MREIEERNIHLKYDVYTLEQQEECAHVPGALCQSQDSWGWKSFDADPKWRGDEDCVCWCVVEQMTFPPPGNQEACTLLCCVSPTHNGNVTHGALLPFFPSPFLHHPIMPPPCLLVLSIISLYLLHLIVSSAPPLCSFVWSWGGHDVTAVVFLWAVRGQTLFGRACPSTCFNTQLNWFALNFGEYWTKLMIRKMMWKRLMGAYSLCFQRYNLLLLLFSTSHPSAFPKDQNIRLNAKDSWQKHYLDRELNNFTYCNLSIFVCHWLIRYSANL